MNLKKTILQKVFLVMMFALVASSFTLAEAKDKKKEKKEANLFGDVYLPKYWYITGEFFSPMMFDDLYSWTSNKYHFGKGLSLKGGYMFNNIFGLELSGAYGMNKMSPNSYQKDYVLGMRDAYTYYPYTQIDGVIYSYPVKDLFGEQGYHNTQDVSLSGVGFNRIYSDVKYAEVALRGVFNLTSLFSGDGFYANSTERPVEFFVKPGAYLSRFSSKVKLVDDATSYVPGKSMKKDEVVAPNVNNKYTFGLGADALIRFNLSKSFAFDFTNRIVWERDREIDGVRSIKRAYDAFVWSPAVGLTYKFRKKFKFEFPDFELPFVEAEMPHLAYFYPQAPKTQEPKKREHTAAIYLTYPLNKTHIVADLHNNPKELAKLDDEIKNYLNNEDYTIRSVKIEGFASPEGPYDNNMRLAEGRARSLIDYIVGRTSLSRGMFLLGRMTENWDGLKAVLKENTSIYNRDKFIDICNQIKDTEVLKQRIQKVDGYKELLANIYPTLRLSSYTVEYEVKSYTIAEAKTRLKTNPTSLSAEEIYSVALDYGLQTTEGENALRKLYDIYPSSDLAITIRGLQQMDMYQYTEAIETLNKVKVKSGLVLNALGVAHANLYKSEAALELFKEAALTDEHAKRNLELITNYLNSVKEVKENNE